MRDQLIGNGAPVLSILLEPGESVVAQAGEFSWMSDSIQVTAPAADGTGDPPDGPGGSPVPLSTYSATGTAGTVAFAAKLPGSIRAVHVTPGRDYLVHRHGFLAGTAGIQVGTGFRQALGPGVFAAGGFVLHRISGEGRAWIELGGEVVPWPLAAGQSVRVHPGHVGMFEATVSFQVMRVPGMANRYFAGDTHHFAVLSGPGRAWLQSAPLPVLACPLAPYLDGLARSPAPPLTPLPDHDITDKGTP